RGVDGLDPLRDRGRLPCVATQQRGRNQVELHQISQRLRVARIEGQRQIDFLPKPSPEQHLLDCPGALRRYSQHFGELPIVFRDLPVERDCFLGERQWRRMLAEGVPDSACVDDEADAKGGRGLKAVRILSANNAAFSVEVWTSVRPVAGFFVGSLGMDEGVVVSQYLADPRNINWQYFA